MQRFARSAKAPVRCSALLSRAAIYATRPEAGSARSKTVPAYMKREILISATAQETRVAILEDDVLVELMVDRPDNERIVGAIYLGQVQAVLPGIQAAFVDIGTEKAAFLHVSDVAKDPDEEDDEAPAPSKH